MSPEELGVGCHLAAILVTLIAAVTDTRTGRIPNPLTYLALLLGPLAWGVIGGRTALLESVMGILFCGIAPVFFLFWRGAPRKEDGTRETLIKGGDVKLFLAIGGLCGPFVGIEAQFYSVLAAALFGIGMLAYRGRLLHALGNSFFIFLNPLLPAKWRREIRPEMLTMIRLGPFIFAGTTAAVILRHPDWYAGIMHGGAQ